MKKNIKIFFSLYTEGFRNLSTLGKKLWILIFIKLFIMFVILKIFFFPNFLGSKFDTSEEKSNYILNILTKQSEKND
ncbi:MAG: DUF4492 domain-containing protein [Bacteroidales bacterium]|nr:DUF4492 domain-containing protein [Bacteroidales bacterium]